MPRGASRGAQRIQRCGTLTGSYGCLTRNLQVLSYCVSNNHMYRRTCSSSSLMRRRTTSSGAGSLCTERGPRDRHQRRSGSTTSPGFLTKLRVPEASTSQCQPGGAQSRTSPRSNKDIVVEIKKLKNTIWSYLYLAKFICLEVVHLKLICKITMQHLYV